MSHRHILGLDLVRFASAALVFFYHLGFSAYAKPGNAYRAATGEPPLMPEWGWFAGVGWVGVQIFFVLSGVVIAFSLDGATPRSFMRSRMARLLPAMVICATWIVVVRVAWSGDHPGWMAVLWFNSVLFSPVGQWVVSTIWTLPVEIVFYALVATCAVGRRSVSLRTIAWGLLTASLVFWAVVPSLGLAQPVDRYTALTLLPHGCLFALGIMMAQIARTGLQRADAPFLVLAFIAAYAQIHGGSDYYVGGYAVEVDLAFAVWLGAMVLIATSLAWRGSADALAGVWSRLVRHLGLATYPLYLLHMHVGGPILVEMRLLDMPDGLALLTAFAATLAASSVVVIALEPPLRRFLFPAAQTSKRAPAAFAPAAR